MTQHGLLPVQRCPHEQSPRSFPCHGQVTSTSTVALETNSVPLHGFPPPCRSRRHKALPPSHFASSAPLAREVLLMFIPSSPSCACFRHPDRSLLINSGHFIHETHQLSRRRDSFQAARVATQRRPPFPQSSRWTRFQSVGEIFRNPRTEHKEEIFATAGLLGWTPFQACERKRLLGSLHTHVNTGSCTFCRCDPVAKDSRQLHCGTAKLVHVLHVCSLSQGSSMTVQAQAEHTHAVVDLGILFQVVDIGTGNQRQ